jgi:hypothetical protein
VHLSVVQYIITCFERAQQYKRSISHRGEKKEKKRGISKANIREGGQCKKSLIIVIILLIQTLTEYN